ncbi:YceI family protein [Sporosarcina oncorhynchi]|uniref:YceI family protein n=1 Tax=Sporosarcina oncorhynchi TaxID=3056444 RepID=A0ABZ0LAS1_9BACL|nr:YceI family protein [Sporosarcina sp. T2O-4]WOV88684.1 YceI family protein [Sporosarcina sp. T2O-4]
MKKWNVDGTHTNVGFSVRHMMVSNVKGSFTGIEGTVIGDVNNLTDAKIHFEIDVNSINTNNEDRDNHLRSEDFFAVEKYPNITFDSTDIVETGKDKYDVTGDLTVKDVTKKTTFKVTRTGAGKNPWGVDVVGFETETKISRKGFGLTWNQALETGGVLVGDDIKISVELQVNPA